MEETYVPLKDRLVKRFNELRNEIGADWQKKLAESDPFFNTREGSKIMSHVGSVNSPASRVGHDRIERVVDAMEKISLL